LSRLVKNGMYIELEERN